MQRGSTAHAAAGAGEAILRGGYNYICYNATCGDGRTAEAGVAIPRKTPRRDRPTLRQATPGAYAYHFDVGGCSGGGAAQRVSLSYDVAGDADAARSYLQVKTRPVPGDTWTGATVRAVDADGYGATAGDVEISMASPRGARAPGRPPRVAFERRFFSLRVAGASRVAAARRRRRGYSAAAAAAEKLRRPSSGKRFGTEDRRDKEERSLDGLRGAIIAATAAGRDDADSPWRHGSRRRRGRRVREDGTRACSRGEARVSA